jgi:hydroxymethylpyrimidine pyrophosphatase-like HAD family hydrolase
MGGLEKDFFLATGRAVKYVKALCKRFDVWRAVIAENGAVIYFPHTKKTITINTESMKRAKKKIREMNLEGAVTGKVIASVREKDIERVRKELGALCESLGFERNGDEIMVLPKGVDKGLGIRLAMRYLDIDLEGSVVVGDGENDISMFLNPGFKIALANADEKLKKLANHITDAPAAAGMQEIISELKRNS